MENCSAWKMRGKIVAATEPLDDAFKKKFIKLMSEERMLECDSCVYKDGVKCSQCGCDLDKRTSNPTAVCGIKGRLPKWLPFLNSADARKLL